MGLLEDLKGYDQLLDADDVPQNRRHTLKVIGAEFGEEVVEGVLVTTMTVEGGVGATGPAGDTGPAGPAGTVNLSHAPFVSLSVTGNAVDIDLSDGGIFELELDDDATTVTMSGETTGEANFFTLSIKQDGTGGWAFTPPASWTFSTGAYVVSSAANAVDLLQGISYDNGVTWLVSYLRNYIT